ncbi:hypothetical protein PENSPDRAFT_183199 [Peniophora sp. CONT]|nr:hypothetical protein PENSPDRAFT_183199 [Peniophora sp. CONT]
MGNRDGTETDLASSALRGEVLPPGLVQHKTRKVLGHPDLDDDARAVVLELAIRLGRERAVGLFAELIAQLIFTLDIFDYRRYISRQLVMQWKLCSYQGLLAH